MELATTLKSQQVRNSVRDAGINPNHWYAVSWSDRLKPGQVIAVTVWQQAIAVYRDTEGNVHALEDACPHKGVALHKGLVLGQNLACRYHGWEFDSQGECAKIPYLPPSQKLPCAKARSYPICDRYNLLWIFPGDPALAETTPVPHIAEFDQPGYLMVPVTGHFKAHFSICNENSMDVFHGFLHENLQGWFDPQLVKLRETDGSVIADYQVSYRGKLAKFLGLTDQAKDTTTKIISVQYRYPHYFSNLENVSSLYLMRLPVSPTESRSFAYFFLKVRLPQWLINSARPALQHILENYVFMKFLRQDIEMMESEQQTYLKEPQRRYVEINPAIIAVQRLILRQSEQAIAPESDRSPARNKDAEVSVS
ncbi:aromatic ring-hydroxylating dioxygenase subunit alpha [Geitlerinema sp. PCC 7407]|uniref:aromatic ring-hydroxylating dioxygenase subunit alpha n=1 Tax=Geitlerinema sp. PCC 7407 TaxID=1173025 RepID=UPI00029FBCC7|nr:aromatic ring-hydroxylating dioxygenase subunit alpha [Geitlerinema sp. PCC 7407]AFY67546.1 Rieske (2Fe-2S) iron-sulfur domain protein [Geitlerinema sp. PCC 7407]